MRFIVLLFIGFTTSGCGNDKSAPSKVDEKMHPVSLLTTTTTLTPISQNDIEKMVKATTAHTLNEMLQMWRFADAFVLETPKIHAKRRLEFLRSKFESSVDQTILTSETIEELSTEFAMMIEALKGCKDTVALLNTVEFDVWQTHMTVCSTSLNDGLIGRNKLYGELIPIAASAVFGGFKNSLNRLAGTSQEREVFLGEFRVFGTRMAAIIEAFPDWNMYKQVNENFNLAMTMVDNLLPYSDALNILVYYTVKGEVQDTIQRACACVGFFLGFLGNGRTEALKAIGTLSREGFVARKMLDWRPHEHCSDQTKERQRETVLDRLGKFFEMISAQKIALGSPLSSDT
jgi:hypothetical protein